MSEATTWEMTANRGKTETGKPGLPAAWLMYTVWIDISIASAISEA